MAKYLLRLYLTKETEATNRIVEGLRAVCTKELDGEYEVEVINILLHPVLANGDEILATPTIVRKLPLPVRHIVGDLTDMEKVLVGLQLKAA